MKTLFVSAETDPRETRVAATPTDVKKLAKLGWAVRVCRSAGIKAGFTDEQYADSYKETLLIGFRFSNIAMTV